jgi:hypothetical protein
LSSLGGRGFCDHLGTLSAEPRKSEPKGGRIRADC